MNHSKSSLERRIERLEETIGVSSLTEGLHDEEGYVMGDEIVGSDIPFKAVLGRFILEVEKTRTVGETAARRAIEFFDIEDPYEHLSTKLIKTYMHELSKYRTGALRSYKIWSRKIR